MLTLEEPRNAVTKENSLQSGLADHVWMEKETLYFNHNVRLGLPLVSITYSNLQGIVESKGDFNFFFLSIISWKLSAQSLCQAVQEYVGSAQKEE